MERKRTDVFDDRVLDLDTILHPSQIFERPADVLNDPDLSLNEKRAILASWASDACAVEAAPALRKNPCGRVVSFDDIMDALRMLDKQACAAAAGDRRRAGRRRVGRGGTGAGDQGAPLH
jgi:7,8-dihydro-6-hydroxymethylpterin-pyrophosphokinase